MTAPHDEHDEPEADELSGDEAVSIRETLEAFDRGEGVDGATAFAEVREELEALAAVEARRARRTG